MNAKTNKTRNSKTVKEQTRNTDLI